MTRINQPSAQTLAEAHAAGWIASLILHGALALGAFTFLQQITLAPQTASFTWNVAMVTPTGPTKPDTTTQQSAPAAGPTPRSLLSKTKSASRPIEPLTPTVDGRAPLPPTPRLLEEQSLSRPVEQSPPLNTTEPVAQGSRAADSAPHPPTSTVSPLPESSHDAPIGPKDASSLQQTTTSTEPSVAALSQAKSDKADFGWLNDDVVRWYEQFNKFYPPDLRLEGTAGSVKLRMLLGKDGVVSNVRIAESSGNAQLDQAAIEIIGKTPPIELSRPLGQASKPITFWYRFKLEPAR